VLCAVSYTVAEDEWHFTLCYGFFLCIIVYTVQTHCVSADFFLSVEDFFLSFAPGHLCITPVYSE